MNTVAVLKLTLHHGIVGYLAGFQSGKNILVFTDSFRSDQQRPTLSLLTSPLYPQVDKILEKTYFTHQRLHPLLSNLLPEGTLRELIAQNLKVHIDNQFQLLAALGHDLPGALIATPLDPEEIPDEIKFKLQISNPDQILKQEIRTDSRRPNEVFHESQRWAFYTSPGNGIVSTRGLDCQNSFFQTCFCSAK